MWQIVTMNNCPWCDKAYELIHQKDEEAVVKLINVEEQHNRWIVKLLRMNNIRTVPQVISPEGELIGGYESLLQYFMKGRNNGV